MVNANGSTLTSGELCKRTIGDVVPSSDVPEWPRCDIPKPCLTAYLRDREGVWAAVLSAAFPGPAPPRPGFPREAQALTNGGFPGSPLPALLHPDHAGGEGHRGRERPMPVISP